MGSVILSDKIPCTVVLSTTFKEFRWCKRPVAMCPVASMGKQLTKPHYSSIHHLVLRKGCIENFCSAGRRITQLLLSRSFWLISSKLLVMNLYTTCFMLLKKRLQSLREGIHEWTRYCLHVTPKGRLTVIVKFVRVVSSISCPSISHISHECITSE